MRFICALLCAVIWLPAAAPAGAEPDDPEQQLEEVHERLERTRAGIETIRRQRGVTAEDLERLDTELSAVEANLAALQADLAAAQAVLAEAERRVEATKARLEATEQRLADTREHLADEHEVFAARTRSSYMYGGPASMSAAMFDTADAAQFGRATKYVARLMASDRDRVLRVAGLVREIEADTVELENLKAEEAEERAAARTERQRAARLVELEQDVREQVVAQRADRQAALEQLDADEDAHLVLAASLEAESAEIEEELRRRAEEERRRQEEERRRQEEERRRQEEERREREAEEQRQREAEEQRQREAEEQRERERQREAEEQREREADEQRQREAEEQRDRERQGEAERQREREREEQRQREAERQREREREEQRQRESTRRSGGGGSQEQAPASSGRLQRPTAGAMTSGYGYRTHPIYGTRRLHTGIDFGGGHGAPIYAAADGVVVSAGARGGYGLTVIIDHGSGMTTLYAHQSRFAVSGGQRVSRGQVIGYIGSTGVSTGPHLHFEVRINGSPRNPANYL